MKKMLAWVCVCALAVSGLALDTPTFHARFDGSAKADSARGQAEPTTAKGLEFVPGFKGQALRVTPGGLLSYATAGNYQRARGSLSMWVKPLREAPAEPQFLQRLFTDGTMMHLQGFGLCYVNEHYLHCGIDRATQPGPELWGWSQITLTWAADGQGGQGDFRFYVDGLPLIHAEGYMKDIYRLQSRFPDTTGPLFYIGCQPDGNQASHMAIDELKIYDRVLSGDEVRKDYLETFPLHFLPSPQLLLAGKENLVEVAATNLSAKPVATKLSWELESPDGKKIAAGDCGQLSLEPGAKRRFPFMAPPLKPGSYQLRLNEQVYPLYVARLEKLESPAKLELERVERIDCAANLDSSRFAGNDCRVVDDAYREGSRIAFFLGVKEPQRPYLLTVEYPDDAVRTVSVHVSTAMPFGGASHLQTGYCTGGEIKNNGGMAQMQFLWWPETKRTALVFVDRQGTAKAAVASITVDKIVGGIPRLNINPPRELPGREIGMEFEDASLNSCFGSGKTKYDATLAGFGMVVERLVAFMGFTGMNSFTYPATWYGGPNWGNSKSSAVSERKKLHPDLWLELLSWKFAAAGCKFYPSVNMDHDSFLFAQAQAGSATDSILAGADTLYLVNHDGTPTMTWNCRPVYNPFHPVVRRHLLDLVEEMVERSEGSGAFGGVTLWLGRENFLPKGAQCGYDDATVGLFERETGVAVPVDKTAANRFYQRYRFLMDKHREAWLRWRCDKLTDLYLDMLAVIRRQEKDAKLVLGCWTNGDNVMEGDLLEAWYKRGIDIKRLATIPGVVLQRVERADSYRYMAPEGFGLEVIDKFREPSTATAYNDYFNGLRFFEEYYEPRMSLCDPTKNPYWKPIDNCPEANNMYYVGACQGRGRAYLKEMAWTLALTDPLYFNRGGIAEEGQGYLDYFREFAAAFRALPARKFQLWTKAVAEPVFIRELDTPAGHYFYLVNTLETDATTELKISAAVTDLSSGAKLEPTDGALNLALRPYELRSFLAPQGAVIADASTTLPPATLAQLKEGLDALCRSVELGQDKLSPKDRGRYATRVQEARKAFDAKAYFQLDRLLHDRLGDLAMKLSGARPWMVLGPFDNAAKGKIDTALPPDQKLDLQASYPSGDGKTLSWQLVADHNLGVDFETLYGKTDWKFVYAFIKVKAPTARKATLLLGSDDGAKIWLNGKEVFKLDAQRGASKWDNRVPVELQAGDNDLLLKIDDKVGTWRFYLDFEPNEGLKWHQ